MRGEKKNEGGGREREGGLKRKMEWRRKSTEMKRNGMGGGERGRKTNID